MVPRPQATAWTAQRMNRMLGRRRSGAYDHLPRWNGDTDGGPEDSRNSFLAPLLRSAAEDSHASLVEHYVQGARRLARTLPLRSHPSHILLQFKSPPVFASAHIVGHNRGFSDRHYSLVIGNPCPNQVQTAAVTVPAAVPWAYTGRICV